MRLAWITDLHVETLRGEQLQKLHDHLRSVEPEGILLGGDIAEDAKIFDVLLDFRTNHSCPIYFVIGNHDYYHRGFTEIREMARKFVSEHPDIHCLEESDVITLTKQVALVGHGCWGDGKHGDFHGSDLTKKIYDFKKIDELTALRVDWEQAKIRVGELGEMATAELKTKLGEALKNHEQVVILTHVPVFPEAAWYQHRHTNPVGTPHFCCFSVGEMIRQVMAEHPMKSVRIFSGHTHNGGIALLEKNITTITAEADYGEAKIAMMIDV